MKELVKYLRIFVVDLLVILLFIVKWVNTSVWGALILSAAIYIFAGRLGWSDPFTGAELADWFVRLPDSHKLALTSSLLTIVGFLIAFQMATKNWKDQMAASVALTAASEIQSFFSEASRKLTSAHIFAELLLESAKKVSSEKNQDEINFQIDYVHSELHKFLAVRERLIEMSIEVHDFQARYVQSLAPRWGANSQLSIAAEAMGVLTKEIWFTYPIVKSDEPGAADRFLRQIDDASCRQFMQAYDDKVDQINGLSGWISSTFQRPIIDFNFSHLCVVLKMSPDIPGIVRLLKGNSNASAGEPLANSENNSTDEEFSDSPDVK